MLSKRRTGAEAEPPKINRWRHAWRFARWRQRPHAIPWGSFLLVLLATFFIPTLLDIWIGTHRPALVTALHYLVSTVYAVTSLMIVWEVAAAWHIADSAPDESPLAPLPVCTALVVAYLPNEQDIILETLTRMLDTLDVPPDKLEIILAYNTPEPLTVEEDLREIAGRDSRLRLRRVEGSTSKAENVNAALAEATGEIVAVFDADHWPEPDCFRRAWHWISCGWDAVQGRCVIRNWNTNCLTRLIAVEFDGVYGISHQGRAALSGLGIFGGSNGFWRREVLAASPMSQAMLTEDIDLTLRAILSGARIAHDRCIVSQELAPTRLRDWLFQRKRWSQGWLEVTFRHVGQVACCPDLTGRQKAHLLYLLVWGECFPLLAVQVAPLLLSVWVLGRTIHWFGNPYFLVTSILTLASGPFLLLAAYARAGTHGRSGLGPWYLFYGIFGILYSSCKTLVTLVAQYSHFVRDRQWVTTPRDG